MRIYVSGGTGLVGCNILKVAVERHRAQVFATVHRRKREPSIGCAYGVVDVHDRDQVLHSVRAFAPDAIVHAAAVLDLPLIYRDRALGWLSYVESTRYLTEAANEVGAKMILISSDWVFDGTQSMATESTPPNPINYYGLLKVVAETLLAATGNDWAVARVAGVNGVHWARPDLALTQNMGLGNFAVAAARTLGQGQPFTVWEGDLNMRGTPALASEIAEVIMRIAELDGRGIFHVCCRESLTRFELAQATARAFELDGGLIRVGPPDPAESSSMRGIPIPRDTSLDSTYSAERLAYRPPDVAEALAKLRQQMETGEI